jgi:hypothetical protein
MLACVYMHAPCVRVLMRLGANPLQLDFLGRGALVRGGLHCSGAFRGFLGAFIPARTLTSTGQPPTRAKKAGGINHR